MKNCIILLGLMVLWLPHLSAQEEDPNRKPTSEDLLSNHYDENFRPFNKGRAFVRFAFSLSDETLENVPRLFDRVIAGDDFSWDIDLAGGYYVGKYFAVGFGVRYGETKFTGTVIDSNSDTVNTNKISRMTSFIPTIRTSIPLTKNQRLSFYNDIGIGFGFGNSLTRDTKNIDEINKDFGEVFSFSLGISPGITFFAVENFAFEIGINLLGYRLRVDKSTINDVEQSKSVSHDVNFKINLLTLNFGLAYFFRTKR